MRPDDASDHRPESPTIDVFVSYAREDLQAARKLVDLLRVKGRSVWVDLEGLYAGEAWWPSLCRAIDSAQVTVFVISPHSAISAACRAELDYAENLGKRIVPLLWQDPGSAELHPVVQRTQWLLRTADDIDDALVQSLVDVIDSDPAWLRGHTRWLQLALDWERRERPEALLLRGAHLEEANEWLATDGPAREPPVTPVQRAFVDRSRRADGLDRARGLLGADHPARAMALLLETQDTSPVPDAASHALLIACLRRLRQCESLSASHRGVEKVALDGEGLMVAGDVDRATAWDLRSCPARRLGELDALEADLPMLAPRGGRLLAGMAGRVVLWNARAWQAVASFDVDPEYATAYAFSADGRWLAAAQGMRVRLLGAQDGRVQQEFEHGRSIGIDAVSFSPDGASLLVRSPERLQLWSISAAASCWSIAAGTRSAFWSARFSGDGSAIVTTRGNRRVAVWRSADGAALKTLVGPEGGDYQDGWFVDGDRAILAFDGLYTRSWAWPAGKGSGVAVGGDSLFALPQSGSTIAFSSRDRSGRIELRNVHSGALTETLRRHEGSVTALAWTADAEHLVSGHDNGMLVQWAMSTRSVHGLVDTRSGSIGHVQALADDAGVVATCGNGSVRLWRFAPSLAVRPLPGSLRAAIAHPAAAFAVAIDRDDGRAICHDGEFADARGPLLSGNAGVRLCVFSPNATKLAIVDRDDRIVVLDVGSRQVAHSWKGPEGSYVVSWDRAGRRLLARSRDRCAVYDTAMGSTSLVLGTRECAVEDAALSPDGRRLCVAEAHFEVRGKVSRGTGYGARLIDVDAGTTVAPIVVDEDPANRQMRRVEFSPDGKHCLAVLTTDGSAALADAGTGVVLRTFGQNDQRVSVAAWLPGGARIMTAGGEAVELWSAREGARLARHDIPNVRAFVRSAAGGRAATVGSHSVHLWDLESWAPLADLADGVDRFPESAAFTASGDGLVIIETDGRAAWYPASAAALRHVAQPWREGERLLAPGGN